MARLSLANLVEAREIPTVGEVSTLLRLNGLYRAIPAFKEDAGAVGPFFQSQPLTILGQAHEALDKVELR
jgi:hypothetical protein